MTRFTNDLRSRCKIPQLEKSGMKYPTPAHGSNKIDHSILSSDAFLSILATSKTRFNILTRFCFTITDRSKLFPSGPVCKEVRNNEKCMEINANRMQLSVFSIKKQMRSDFFFHVSSQKSTKKSRVNERLGVKSWKHQRPSESNHQAIEKKCSSLVEYIQ